MAIIGQSKHKDLYQRITEDGSKYRELTYADLGYSRLEEPILHGYLPEDPLEGNATSIFRKEGVPPIEQKRLSTTELKSEVLLPLVTRIDDTERITRLLTRGRPQGIKWEVHNAELVGIQKQLDNKRGQLVFPRGPEDPSFWQNVGQSLLAAGAGLLDAAKITAETLGQVAVAGTGEHLSVWQDRAYLRKGGAEFALSGRQIEAVVDTEGNPILRFGTQQIPSEENAAVLQAKFPKLRGAALINENQTSADIPGQKQVRWNTGNAYGQAKNNYVEEVLVEESAKRFARNTSRVEETVRNGYELSDEGLSEVRKPGEGRTGIKFKNLGQKDLDKSGSPFVQGITPLDRNTYTDQESGSNSDYIASVQEDVKSESFVLSKVGKEEDRVKRMQESKVPLGMNAVGPWKSEGPLTLLAGTTDKAKLGASAPVGNASSKKNMEGTTNGTRVDNGRIDLIPFWIRALTANGEVLDMAYLFFEANLDSYSDNYTGTWEGTQYVGRADKFWTYTGFDRQIDFSFKVVAHSKAHLKPIYNRLNGLLSMTAPTYQNGMFMQGVLAEVTVGDLLDKQLGFIKSVGLKWETDYMWETDGETIRVPHALNASVSFTPIHQFVPQIRRRYFNLVGDVKKPAVDTFITSKERLYKKKD